MVTASKSAGHQQVQIDGFRLTTDDFKISFIQSHTHPIPSPKMPASRRRTRTTPRSHQPRSIVTQRCNRRRGGGASNTIAPLRSAYNFTNQVSQDIVHSLTSVFDGLANGACAIVDTTGNLVDLAGTKFEVCATQIFKGAGGLAKRCADGLGTVIRKVPGVGGPVGGTEGIGVGGTEGCPVGAQPPKLHV